jgi:hypothetical protein
MSMIIRVLDNGSVSVHNGNDKQLLDIIFQYKISHIDPNDQMRTVNIQELLQEIRAFLEKNNYIYKYHKEKVITRTVHVFIATQLIFKEEEESEVFKNPT